jgi:hypothetical protein
VYSGENNTNIVIDTIHQLPLIIESQQANGSVFDAMEASAIWRIDAVCVEIRNVNFTNATSATGDGAAVSITAGHGETIRCVNCHFADNRARRGGALALHGDGNLWLDQCSFSSNYANIDVNDTTGGGGGGAVFVDSGMLRIDRSFFRFNNALRASGGAVYVTNATAVDIDATSFVDNEAVTGARRGLRRFVAHVVVTGGAVYIENVVNDETLRWTYCNFRVSVAV